MPSSEENLHADRLSARMETFDLVRMRTPLFLDQVLHQSIQCNFSSPSAEGSLRNTRLLIWKLCLVQTASYERAKQVVPILESSCC